MNVLARPKPVRTGEADSGSINEKYLPRISKQMASAWRGASPSVPAARFGGDRQDFSNWMRGGPIPSLTLTAIIR
jgi:hypothetical protein